MRLKKKVSYTLIACIYIALKPRISLLWCSARRRYVHDLWIANMRREFPPSRDPNRIFLTGRIAGFYGKRHVLRDVKCLRASVSALWAYVWSGDMRHFHEKFPQSFADRRGCLFLGCRFPDRGSRDPTPDSLWTGIVSYFDVGKTRTFEKDNLNIQPC